MFIRFYQPRFRIFIAKNLFLLTFLAAVGLHFDFKKRVWKSGFPKLSVAFLNEMAFDWLQSAAD